MSVVSLCVLAYFYILAKVRIGGGGDDLKNVGADKHFIIPAPFSTPFFELWKLCHLHTG